MVGIPEQYQYILREESLHVNFGIDLINQIKAENPRLLSTALQDEVRQMLHEPCAREVAYGRDTTPAGCWASTQVCARSSCTSSPTAAARSWDWCRCSRNRESLPVDVRSDGSQEGKELLRDTRDGVPDALVTQAMIGPDVGGD
jgi:hypothetical protein